MNTLKEIQIILRESGMVNISMQDTVNRKTYKNYEDKPVKDIRGGSTGPMTSFSEISEKHSFEAISVVCNNLKRSLIDVTTKIDNNLAVVTIPISETSNRVLTFKKGNFPTYTRRCGYDPSYTTQWWVYSSHNVRI